MAELLSLIPLAGGLISGFGQQAGDQAAAAQAAATKNYINNNLTTQTGYQQPYMTAGTQASTMLSNLNGLNGASGQAAAGAAFRTDPGWAAASKYAQDQLSAKANASGNGLGGAQIAQLSQLEAGQMNQAYQDWFRRLQGQVQAGQTATGQLSQFTGLNENSYGNAASAQGYYTGAGIAAPYMGLGGGLAGAGSMLGGMYGLNGGLAPNQRSLQTLFGNSSTSAGGGAGGGGTVASGGGLGTLPALAGTSLSYGV